MQLNMKKLKLWEFWEYFQMRVDDSRKESNYFNMSNCSDWYAEVTSLDGNKSGTKQNITFAKARK